MFVAEHRLVWNKQREETREREAKAETSEESNRCFRVPAQFACGAHRGRRRLGS